MRSLMVVLFALVLGLSAGQARADEPADGIQSVIERQIAAFRANDLDRAFTFASPGIQRQFGDPQNFGRMVQNGYPMVWRPAETNFLSVEVIDGLLWQNVMIRDQAGGIHLLDYQMINTGDGWQINGVQILRAPDVGA